MKTIIFKDYSEFYNREDRDTNGVSLEFSELNPDFEKDNGINKGCWNCSDCSDCSGCSGCEMKNEIAILLFEFSNRDKKTGDRAIKSVDLKKLCEAIEKLKCK